MRDCEKDCSNYNSKWSQEENKLFEVALAIIDEKCPKRWEWVAFMIGNKKTAEEVQKHFEILLEDLNFIESCSLFDHKLGLENFRCKFLPSAGSRAEDAWRNKLSLTLVDDRSC